MNLVTPIPCIQDIHHATRHDKISRRQYTALWTFMMVLHALCAAFLLASAKLYWLLENEYLDYVVSLLAPARDRHFRVVGTALGVLGAAHALQLLSHLGASIIARKLTVRTVNVGLDSISLVSMVVHGLTQLQRWLLHRWRSSRRNRPELPRIASSTHRNPANNETYGREFAIRKTVEIATQVPNGYLYSTLIARSWINHAKVALLVINCWSAFIIHTMLTNDKPANRQVAPSRQSNSQHHVRFSAVVIDAVLATTTGVVLPSAIFLPYLLQFDFESLDFPDSLLYGDTAFPNLVLENRAFFAISWANAVMKGVPHVSAFLCLLALAAMLDSTSKPNSTIPTDHAPSRLAHSTKRSSIATASYRALMHATNNVQNSAKLVRKVHRLAAPLLFLATGAIVLTLHLTAHYGQVNGDIDAMARMCLQRMHPWLAPNFSCAVVKYNCYREKVTSPTPDDLSWLEREAVRTVMFLHCSAFVMPPIIREFPFLMGIEVWNATLVSWGQEAALSAELHPVLLFVVFSFVNMTNVPVGVLHPRLPEQLTDLEFIHTNLTNLPQEVSKSWRNVELIYIEHSRLNPFPTSLLQLPFLSELSLIDNQFETIPEDALLTAASTYFYDLALSKNPLRELPKARTEDFDVSYLALEFTQLRELPDWVSSRVWDSVSLGGSPFCDSSNVEYPENAVCGEDDERWDPNGEECYPTQLIQQYRSLDA